MTIAETRTQLGRYGEACAARHLTCHEGMVVLDRNWRCELGEIDLVLRDGDVLVVCEVKTRSSERFGSTIEAVTEVKAARLRVLAQRWCETRGLRPEHLRIDVVGVLLDGQRIVRIDHARGI
ncbi:MAG TPA: YraN family protein [Nocardioidaceae bacterium]|nr:YraN family protein [Nocardioidaceae bacterium]